MLDKQLGLGFALLRVSSLSINNNKLKGLLYSIYI